MRERREERVWGTRRKNEADVNPNVDWWAGRVTWCPLTGLGKAQMLKSDSLRRLDVRRYSCLGCAKIVSATGGLSLILDSALATERLYIAYGSYTIDLTISLIILAMKSNCQQSDGGCGNCQCRIGLPDPMQITPVLASPA